LTLPDERYRAVLYTKDFLYSLSNPKETPRIPKIVRQRARSLLKHYPSSFDMDRVSDALPEVFDKKKMG